MMDINILYLRKKLIKKYFFLIWLTLYFNINRLLQEFHNDDSVLINLI